MDAKKDELQANESWRPETRGTKKAASNVDINLLLNDLRR